ncbi:MAG: hypothetical protein K9L85_03205, partial [Candidatus Peribacteraceae bacterium]|nr:hypothetical protein [Candidatus Peribacteraceae bacterium]
NPTEVAKILAKTPEGQNRIPGYESGQAIKKALEEAVKKQSSPEAAKKQTVDETGVESKAAGQKVEAGKVTGATQTNIKINNHRVFKKDDKYYFADDNKDVGEGGTLAFTEAELGSHLKDLKFDVQEAKDAKEADALGRRIKKAIDTFGDKAFDQLKGLKFGDDKVKEALVRRLREQHQLKDEVLKKLGIME